MDMFDERELEDLLDDWRPGAAGTSEQEQAADPGDAGEFAELNFNHE